MNQAASFAEAQAPADGGFPGSRFLAASWRSGADAATLARLRNTVAGWTLAEGDGWLLASDKPGLLAKSGAVAVALGRARVFDRRAATLADAQAVAAAVARDGEGALDGMAAPFRAAWAEGGTLKALTDRFGLGHVFLGKADGVALAGSSATLVGDVLAAGPSAETIAAFAFFGNFLGDETPFAGVTRLMAGSIATLTRGRLEVGQARWPEPDAVSAREALQACVAAMVEAAPDAELELSGGLDSRMILAAMPPEARRGRRAITIGDRDEVQDDMAVARGLAQTEGLDWLTLNAGAFTALDGPAFADLLARATLAYDHMANPVDKVALIVAGAGRHVTARFGGQNGEIMRGFYYAGQPLTAQPSDALARRLVAWRLTTNDAVDEAILAPAVRGELKAAAEARARALLLGLGGDWGQTLDRFYLAQRMQNWVGNSAGNRMVDHTPLYPFFDPAFVAAAMAKPASEKLNSRASYRLMTELDPALARRPLAGGVVPAAVPTNAVGRRISDLRQNFDRIMARVQRRLSGGMATLGSASVAQHWSGLGLHRELPFDRLARSGFFDAAALERVARGEGTLNRPTLGFLLLVAELGGRR